MLPGAEHSTLVVAMLLLEVRGARRAQGNLVGWHATGLAWADALARARGARVRLNPRMISIVRVAGDAKEELEIEIIVQLVKL